jgi:hypothetical protein
LLQDFRIAAAKKGIRALLEADTAFLHAIGKPVVLVQTYAGRERKIGTKPDEHASELSVIQVEVVLIDPTVFEIEMATTGVFGFDADKNPSRFSGLNDRNNLIGLCVLEIGFDKFVAPVVRSLKNGSIPGRRTVCHPVLVLACDITKHIPGDRIDFSVCAEKADHSLWLLKRLDGRIEKHSVEAAIMEIDAILMVLIEGVHGYPSNSW